MCITQKAYVHQNIHHSPKHFNFYCAASTQAVLANRHKQNICLSVCQMHECCDFLSFFPTLDMITADIFAAFGYRVKINVSSFLSYRQHLVHNSSSTYILVKADPPCIVIYLRQQTYLFLFNNTVDRAHQRKEADRNSLTVASSAFKQLSERSSIPSTSDVSHFDCTTSISRFTPLDVIPV